MERERNEKGRRRRTFGRISSPFPLSRMVGGKSSLSSYLRRCLCLTFLPYTL